jgi:tagatose 1,6-diphosphate aldolase
MTTMGKFRHLSRCSTPEGHFAILAIDHRQNLLERLEHASGGPFADHAFIGFKQQIITTLVADASAVLTDPAYGIAESVSSHTIDGRVGLLSPIEVTDYGTHPSQRGIEFIQHWSVEKIKRMGGDGIKLLLPYHPESPSADERIDVVKDIITVCERQDIPFFLEPIPHTLRPDDTMSNIELLELVVESARVFSEIGADILKLPFPVNVRLSHDLDEWQRACETVNAACTVPWTLLSAGVDYETFEQQATVACKAGASGVMVGRAVWAEAVNLNGTDRTGFLKSTARARMQQLANICAEHATPWTEHVSPPNAAVDWFERY